MTRSEALKSLLKSIFGSVTLSVDNQEIVRGKNSLYHNCYYNLNSYNKFKELFKIAFLCQIKNASNFKEADREKTIQKAKEYLSLHNIFIPENYDINAQCKIICDFLTEYFLKVIVIDENDHTQDIAKNTDISLKLIEVHNNAECEFNKICTQYDVNNYIKKEYYEKDVIDPECNDKCNFEQTFFCTEFDVYNTLLLIRNLALPLPVPKENLYLYIHSFDNIFFPGTFTDKGIKYVLYNIMAFPDSYKLKDKIRWKTYIDRDAIITRSESRSLLYSVSNYKNELIKRAKEQVEERLHEELREHYKNNALALENLIKNILAPPNVKSHLENINLSQNSEDLKSFLFGKCSSIFLGFDIPYLIIQNTYPDNIIKGLYITLQNAVIELTELLDHDGKNIAQMFKLELDNNRFNEHKRIIKKNLSSKNLNDLIEIEKHFYNNYPDYFSEPQSISDVFHCIRKNTFYNFYNALYKYHNYINPPKS